MLLAFGPLGTISVAGWTRQLARSCRASGSAALGMVMGGTESAGDASPTSALFVASNELLDQTLTPSLNAHRKLFYMPTIVTAAFAVFVLADTCPRGLGVTA